MKAISINPGLSTKIIGTAFCSFAIKATMIRRPIKPDSELARTASGWDECKNWTRSFYTSAMTIDFRPQGHWADNNAEVIKTAAAVAEQPKRTLSIWGD
jgi:hypothetical protein